MPTWKIVHLRLVSATCDESFHLSIVLATAMAAFVAIVVIVAFVAAHGRYCILSPLARERERETQSKDPSQSGRRQNAANYFHVARAECCAQKRAGKDRLLDDNRQWRCARPPIDTNYIMFGNSGVNIVDRPPPKFEIVGVLRDRFCAGCLQPDSSDKRWMVCSRCKVTPYCSPECQKEHFCSHKKDCKQVDRIAKSDDPRHYLPLAQKLFCVCYRSCDDDFRKVHWEVCIDAYNLALSKGIRGYQIHDEMALVWLGLDKLAMALEELIKNVEFGPDPSPGIKVKGLTVLDDTMDVPKAWNTEWTETDLLILLAIKLQVIAQLRAGPASFGKDLQAAMPRQDRAHVKAALKEQERQAKRIVRDIGTWWGGGIAKALRDARPFSNKESPNVIFTQPEQFRLLQDIFFKTPGVKDVLYEFVK